MAAGALHRPSGATCEATVRCARPPRRYACPEAKVGRPPRAPLATSCLCARVALVNMDHAIGTDAISILTGMLRTRLRFRVVRGPPPAYGRCPSRFGAALAKPH